MTVLERAELDALDRDALVARAESLGLARARVLTRPELVDEILLRSGAVESPNLALARGLFGLARDLLARVVERGLNRPDAAERIRALGLEPPPSREAPDALPTVTLAQIYVAQGHVSRARKTLVELLDVEPAHEDARRLLDELDRPSFLPPEPALPPEPEVEPSLYPEAEAEAEVALEAPASDPAAPPAAGAAARPPAEPPLAPSAYFDVAPPSTTLRASLPDDDVCAVARADGGLFVRFAVPSLEAPLAAGARIVLRAHLVVPSWDGVEVVVRDRPLDEVRGSLFVPLDRPGVARAAVGAAGGDGTFVPVAHSDAVELG